MDNSEDKIEQTEIKGIAKVRVAKNFTHLEHLIPFVSSPTDHFKYIAKMVTTVPVYRISRSRLTSLKDFSAHIQKEVGVPVSK